MLALLRRPLPPIHFIGLLVGSALAVALYCIGYNALTGRSESLATALGWALANICPWIVAIELGKRAPAMAGAVLILLAAAIASVLIGYATGASAGTIGFELWRRLPSLALSAGTIALLRSQIGSGQQAAAMLPIAPAHVEWVRAAGNYVEIRTHGRTIVHRTSIGAAERHLRPHGFVRIHRSTLVRRDRIARIRPQDVVLTDGTHLKVGKRFRSELAG